MSRQTSLRPSQGGKYAKPVVPGDSQRVAALMKENDFVRRETLRKVRLPAESVRLVEYSAWGMEIPTHQIGSQMKMNRKDRDQEIADGLREYMQRKKDRAIRNAAVVSKREARINAMLWGEDK